MDGDSGIEDDDEEERVVPVVSVAATCSTSNEGVRVWRRLRDMI